jgi:hypothetical protein
MFLRGKFGMWLYFLRLQLKSLFLRGRARNYFRSSIFVRGKDTGHPLLRLILRGMLYKKLRPLLRSDLRGRLDMRHSIISYLLDTDKR